MKFSVKSVFLLTGLFVMSCQNSMVEEEIPSETQEVRELDLQSFSFNDVQALLKGGKEIRNLRLTDGEIVKDISVLKKMENVEIAGTDENDVIFYAGENEDSINVILEKSYASIKFRHQGTELGYVAVTDQSEVERSIENYSKEFPATRAESNLFTRSSANGPLKIDITALSRTLLSENEEPACTTIETEQAENTEVPVQTRSAYYTQWPRYNRLTIHVIRDAGSRPIEWELTWQLNDLITSLRDIRSDLDIRVWRSNTSYSSSNIYNASASLSAFADYCRSGSFPYGESSGHDIICLVRWGKFGDNRAGIGYANAYKLSRYTNYWAYGISATTPLYGKALAHEVGHILGANHVAATPWWQFWRSDDLMAPTSGKLAPYHWNSNNRNTIWNNLH